MTGPVPLTTGDPGPGGPRWRSIGCTVSKGPAERPGDPFPWCGGRIVAAMVVGTYPLPLDMLPDVGPETAALLLCAEHAAALGVAS